MASDAARQPALSAPHWTRRLGDGVYAGYRRLMAALSADWAGSQVFAYGAIVALLACAVAGMFLVNNPAPFLPYHDSHEYIASAHRIMAGESWADPQRLPGYPLFLAIIFIVTGSTTNLMAAQLAQMGLFVVVALEVYVIGYRLWKHTRLAALVAALVGTNVYFLEFVRPILSDGLALFLATTLALAIVVFIERPGARLFWLVAVLTLALFMTRADWYLLPVPLFAYLLFVAHRHGLTRRLLPHAIAAIVLLYAVQGGYIAMNAHVNGFAGLTSDENINLYGKVLQYHMEGEAPAQFANIASSTELDILIHHTRDPWAIFWADPALGRNNFSVMGDYARSVILHHPAQFLADSVPLAFNSLYDPYQFGGINVYRRLAKPLKVLLNFSTLDYALYLLFPLCAAGWLIVLLRRPRRSGERRRAEMAGALTLLALYDLAVTTVGSYGEYGRLHLGFDPLMLIVVVGSIALFVSSNRKVRSPRGDVEQPVESRDSATGRRSDRQAA